MRKIFATAAIALATLIPGLTSAPASADLILPPADIITIGDLDGNALLFDDFTVYSLALLNYEAGYGAPGGNDPFNVKSGPGQIQDETVIGTGPGGGSSCPPVCDNSNIGTDVDNAFETPNSVPGGSTSTTFLTISETDPDPAIAHDNFWDTYFMGEDIATTGATWDADLGELAAFLGGEDMYLFFNLNDENPGGLDDGQDMLVYLNVILTDTSACNGTDLQACLDSGAAKDFTLSGNNNTSGVPNVSWDQHATDICVHKSTLAILDATQSCDASTLDDLVLEQDKMTVVPDNFLPTANDKWAFVHGDICVANDGSYALIALQSCQRAGLPGITINQNLGANSAAFAIFNQELSDLINGNIGNTYDLISIDGRMTHIDNGFEQLWIQTLSRINVPEPATLGIMGIGLVGMGWAGRRRRKS